MSYRVEYKGETSRIKLYYSDSHRLEKVKLLMNNGMVHRSDVYNGLKFLERQGLVLSKRHARRVSEEQLKNYIGVNEIVDFGNNVKIGIYSSSNNPDIVIANDGVVTNEFLDNDGLNIMIDLYTTIYNYR